MTADKPADPVAPPEYEADPVAPTPLDEALGRVVAGVKRTGKAMAGLAPAPQPEPLRAALDTLRNVVEGHRRAAANKQWHQSERTGQLSAFYRLLDDVDRVLFAALQASASEATPQSESRAIELLRLIDTMSPPATAEEEVFEIRRRIHAFLAALESQP